MSVGAPPESRLLEVAVRDLESVDLGLAAARALFDALCCMRAGAPAAPTMAGARAGGSASVIGAGTSAALIDAIALNATSSHVLDRDDLHWPTLTHAGSVIWPVAIGVGEQENATLARVYEAAALGYQVTVRTAALLGPAHRRAFHVTATAGAVGAAAAAASLLHATPPAVERAIRSALSTIGGTRQAVAELSNTGAWHRASAAVAGALAARLDVLEPVRSPLSGELGFAAATGRELDEASMHRPAVPALIELTIRTHGVTGFAHALVDAIAELGALDPAQIEGIEVQLPAWIVDIDRGTPPESSREAAWDLRFVAALAVAGRVPGHRLAWPPAAEVLGLRDLVTVTPVPADPGDLSASGVVRLVDGSSRPFARDVPDGHPQRPLSREALLARAVSLGAFASPNEAAKVLDALTDPRARVADVVRLVVAPA